MASSGQGLSNSMQSPSTPVSPLSALHGLRRPASATHRRLRKLHKRAIPQRMSQQLSTSRLAHLLDANGHNGARSPVPLLDLHLPAASEVHRQLHRQRRHSYAPSSLPTGWAALSQKAWHALLPFLTQLECHTVSLVCHSWRSNMQEADKWHHLVALRRGSAASSKPPKLRISVTQGADLASKHAVPRAQDTDPAAGKAVLFSGLSDSTAASDENNESTSLPDMSLSLVTSATELPRATTSSAVPSTLGAVQKLSLDSLLSPDSPSLLSDSDVSSDVGGSAISSVSSSHSQPNSAYAFLNSLEEDGDQGISKNSWREAQRLAGLLQEAQTSLQLAENDYAVLHKFTTEEMARLHGHIEEAETELEEAINKNDELTDDNEALREQLIALEDDYKDRLRVSANMAKSLERENTVLAAEVKTLKAELRVLEDNSKEYVKSIHSLESNIATLSERLDSDEFAHVRNDDLTRAVRLALQQHDKQLEESAATREKEKMDQEKQRERERKQQSSSEDSTGSVTDEHSAALQGDTAGFVRGDVTSPSAKLCVHKTRALKLIVQGADAGADLLSRVEQWVPRDTHVTKILELARNCQQQLLRAHSEVQLIGLPCKCPPDNHVGHEQEIEQLSTKLHRTSSKLEQVQRLYRHKQDEARQLEHQLHTASADSLALLASHGAMSAQGTRESDDDSVSDSDGSDDADERGKFKSPSKVASDTAVNSSPMPALQPRTQSHGGGNRMVTPNRARDHHASQRKTVHGDVVARKRLSTECDTSTAHMAQDYFATLSSEDEDGNRAGGRQTRSPSSSASSSSEPPSPRVVVQMSIMPSPAQPAVTEAAASEQQTPLKSKALAAQPSVSTSASYGMRGDQWSGSAHRRARSTSGFPDRDRAGHKHSMDRPHRPGLPTDKSADSSLPRSESNRPMIVFRPADATYPGVLVMTLLLLFLWVSLGSVAPGASEVAQHMHV